MPSFLNLPSGSVTKVTKTTQKQTKNKKPKNTKIKTETKIIAPKVVRPPKGLSAKEQAFRTYVDCLEDPFYHSGMRMGFNTMVPTNLNTLYNRGSFTTNATGEFRLAFIPAGTANANSVDNRGCLWYDNRATLTPGSWSNGVTWRNGAILTTTAIEGRLLGGGIRILPAVAGTAAPGMIYTVSVPQATYTQLTAALTTEVVSHPLAVWSDGRLGARCTARPIDMESLEMRKAIITGYGDNETTHTSTCLMYGVGFQPNTTIYYEVIANIESVVGPNNNTTGIGSQQGDVRDGGPTLSDFWPSSDALWAAAKQVVTPAAVGAITRTVLKNHALPGATVANTIGATVGELFAHNRKHIENTWYGPFNPVRDRV